MIFRNFISDEALSQLLGSNAGINHRIKAYHVLKYFRRLKVEMKSKITIENGTFVDGRKYSFINLESLILFLLNCLGYAEVVDSRKVISPFFP